MTENKACKSEGVKMNPYKSKGGLNAQWSSKHAPYLTLKCQNCSSGEKKKSFDVTPIFKQVNEYPVLKWNKIEKKL